MKRIVTLDEFSTLTSQFKGKKVVLVGGCFDVLHYGHVVFLQKARQEGDMVVVALEPDESIREKKNREPVHKQIQRAEVLQALRDVDFVILLPRLKNDEEYFNMVKTIHPYVIATTKGDPQIKNKQKQADIVSGRVVEVTPLVEPFSSSYITHYATISRN